MPGGVGGVTGGAEITGAVRTEEAGPVGTTADGAVALHPSITMQSAARAAARTGE